MFAADVLCALGSGSCSIHLRLLDEGVAMKCTGAGSEGGGGRSDRVKLSRDLRR